MVLLGTSMLIVALVKSESFTLLYVPICVLTPFFVMKDMKRLNAISYDDYFLYFGKPVADQKTPLENIRSITVGRYDFSIRINLYDPVLEKRHVFFKPRVFYWPFVPMSNLENIYELRDRVDRVKKEVDMDYEGETKILKMASFG
jgi:hypothetical protein